MDAFMKKEFESAQNLLEQVFVFILILHPHFAWHSAELGLIKWYKKNYGEL